MSQSLASAIARREGNKSQARIGDIREVLKIITDLIAEQLLATNNQRSDFLSKIDEDAHKKFSKLQAKQKKAEAKASK